MRAEADVAALKTKAERLYDLAVGLAAEVCGEWCSSHGDGPDGCCTECKDTHATIEENKP